MEKCSSEKEQLQAQPNQMKPADRATDVMDKATRKHEANFEDVNDLEHIIVVKERKEASQVMSEIVDNKI